MPATIDPRHDAATIAVRRAASELFREHSYSSVTIKQIAERAEVNERTLYRRFGSKEELVLAEVRELIPRIGEEFRRRPTDESPLEAILETFRHVARTEQEPLAILAAGSPLIGETDSRRAGALLASFETALAGFLLERYESESFTRLTAGVISRASIGAVRSAIALRRESPDGTLRLGPAFAALRTLS